MAFAEELAVEHTIGGDELCVKVGGCYFLAVEARGEFERSAGFESDAFGFSAWEEFLREEEQPLKEGSGRADGRTDAHERPDGRVVWMIKAEAELDAADAFLDVAREGNFCGAVLVGGDGERLDGELVCPEIMTSIGAANAIGTNGGVRNWSAGFVDDHDAKDGDGSNCEKEKESRNQQDKQPEKNDAPSSHTLKGG